nr:MAG TPA: hypothetical protein [Caudoviricetes sp.]
MKSQQRQQTFSVCDTTLPRGGIGGNDRHRVKTYTWILSSVANWYKSVRRVYGCVVWQTTCISLGWESPKSYFSR